MLKHINVPLPDSTSSHKDLIALAVEKNIISEILSIGLDEYRAFRHFFVHGYDILLNEAPLQPLAENLPEIWQRFENEINEFLASLE